MPRCYSSAELRIDNYQIINVSLGGAYRHKRLMEKWMSRMWLTTAAVLTLPLAGAVAAAQPAAWREAYQSSPASYEQPSEEMIKAAAEQMKIKPEAIRAALTPRLVTGTIRYRVKVTTAGKSVRVRLSNEEGATPLQLTGASLGLIRPDLSVQAGSIRRLTFGGRTAVTIPAGAPLISDPVGIPVHAGSELVFSAALASSFSADKRAGGGGTLAPGNQVMLEVMSETSDIAARPLVTGVEVLASPATKVIVAFGDSITDGNRSRQVEAGSWPAELARRLNARTTGPRYAVVNAGIGGNRLLAPSWGVAGLGRLDRDALRIEGLSHLILLEGINDIGMSGMGPFGNNPEITADDLIAGYRQVIARAKARGVNVIIGTLTPTQGSASHSSPSKDAIRTAVNRWIRTSGEPDGVVDFDAVTRDPAAPERFLPEYDSGDHLHPNEAGYIAMGRGIDLTLFGR